MVSITFFHNLFSDKLKHLAKNNLIETKQQYLLTDW